MKEDLVELNRRGLAQRWKVLLGGAALNRSYVEQDMREAFEGDVYYGSDAFEGLSIMTALADGRVRISIEARGLPPGPHGAHIHSVGQCTPPDFTSAGAHWNPTNSHHGVRDPQGPHGGDMPNLIVGTNGQASMAITLPAGRYAQMMDADGAAIVIHSGADDLKTYGQAGFREPAGDTSRGKAGQIGVIAERREPRHGVDRPAGDDARLAVDGEWRGRHRWHEQ